MFLVFMGCPFCKAKIGMAQQIAKQLFRLKYTPGRKINYA